MKPTILAFKVSNTNDCNDEAPTTAYVNATPEFYATMQGFLDSFKLVSHKSLYSMDFFYSVDFVNVTDKDGIPNIETHNIVCVDEVLGELQDAINPNWSTKEYAETLNAVELVRTSADCVVITKNGFKFVAYDKYSGDEYSTDLVTIDTLKQAMNDNTRILTEV